MTLVTQIKNIYKALVMRVKKKKVLVDARLKCLYYIPISDFSSEELPAILGKEINVYIKHIDPLMNHNRIASYRRAKQEIIWGEVLKFYRNKELVEGKITNSTKGGYSIYLSIGFYAFLPLSQICEEEADKYKPNSEEVFSFYIIGINRLHFNIVVSRKEVIMQDVAQLNQESMDTINIGASLFGIVKGINANGLFVYINNDYNGFVPAEEAGHGNNIDLYKMFYVGQRIEGIITEISENKIILSIRKRIINPMLEFSRGQKVDVILTKYLVDENNEVTMLGHLATNINIFCRVIKEDKIITMPQIEELIENKKELVVAIKSINEDTYSLVCTTKKSQREIWNNFMLDVQYNNFIVTAKVINKSKYMLFLSYLEKEIYVPITQVSFFDSKAKFEAMQPGDSVNVYIMHLDKRNQEAIGSIRKLELIQDVSIKAKLEQVIQMGIVDASLEYMIDTNYAIFKIQEYMEQSVPCNKITNIMQNLKNNPNIPVKLQIYQYDEHGNLELGAVSEVAAKSNVKTKKFNIGDIISQFKNSEQEPD